VPGRSPDKCKLIPIEEEEEQEDPQTAALRQRCTQQALAASDAADLAAGAFPSTHQPAAHLSTPFLPVPGAGDAWPPQQPLHQPHDQYPAVASYDWFFQAMSRLEGL
jgi:hypothetical protein